VIESSTPPAVFTPDYHIGESWPLYRICRLCGESKYYQSFPLKGDSSLYKRRRYCTDCANRKDDPVSPAIHYNFHVSVLDDTKHGFIRFSGSNKKWCNKITLQEAIRFVSLGKARIRTPHHIVQLTYREPFVEYVLERDAHTCQRCGKRGTEVVRLRELDTVKCFCVECASIIPTDKTPQQGVKQISFSPPQRGELHVYCDGSVSEDQYGCGVVLVHRSGGKTYHGHFRHGREQHSLYAELSAISFALRSILGFLSQGSQVIITSVTVLTDVGHIENFLIREAKRFRDADIAKEVQNIKLTIGDLKKASPEMLVSVRYIGSAGNQLYHLAHRLSRCYKGTVPIIELLPVAAPPKRKVYSFEFRLLVVTEARVAGQFAVTARKFGIAVSTLYRWRQQNNGAYQMI
jgi:ribonuclease HI